MDYRVVHDLARVEERRLRPTTMIRQDYAMHDCIPADPGLVELDLLKASLRQSLPCFNVKWRCNRSFLKNNFWHRGHDMVRLVSVDVRMITRLRCSGRWKLLLQSG